MKKSIHLLALAGAMVVATIFGLADIARAAVIWDESVNGQFSQDRLNPTALNFVSGNNEILGTTGASAPGVVDRDYFTFTVPTGFGLSAITVFIASPDPPDNESFIGIEAGTQITVPPTQTDASGLLGWWHYGLADLGSDILAKMAIASMGSSGFTPPLGADDYSVWIQETSVVSLNYGFDFILTPIPEPASVAGVLTALALFALVRRYRRQQTHQVAV